MLGRIFVYHNWMLGSVEVMLALLGRSRQNFAKGSCHHCTYSTAVICLPSFPFTREAVLVKVFFANCLIIRYSSREFVRSAAFCAACAKLYTDVV